MKAIIALLAAAVIFAGMYLIYEIWHVFGTWTMIISMIFSLGIFPALDSAFGSKTKTADGYKFNPKELPKYLSMMIAAGLGFYFYTRLNNPNLSHGEHTFGLIWIALTNILPIIVFTYMLINNRNDYVEIAGNRLIYRNNEDKGEISLDEVKQAELILDANVKLELLNGQSYLIKTIQMNFGKKDLLDLVETINASLSAAQPTPSTGIA
jgi:hypothetical protein